MTDRRKHVRIILSIVIFFIVLALCSVYFRLTYTPLPGYDLSPSSDLARWSFMLEDGTILQPENGELPLTGTDTVVLCQTQLTEDLTDSPYFVVFANSADCVIYINDCLVYAPSGRFSEGAYSDTEYKPASASGQFIANITGENDTLTMRVQFCGEDNLVRHLPRLTAYYDLIYYYSQTMAPTAEAAFPAGMYFVLALILSGLFLIGTIKEKPDAGLLFLAFGALAMALSSTATYAVNVAWIYRWVSVSWFCSLLPLVMIGWTLWFRLSKRLRLFLLPVISLTSAALLFYLIAGFGQSTAFNAQMNVVQIWIAPGVILLMLIIAGVDAVKGNPWYKRFFCYLACSVPVIALIWGFSALTGGKLAQTIATAFNYLVTYHSLFRLCELLCVLILIICFILAVVDLISGLARKDAELRALTLREKYALENMKLTLDTQKSTRQERHELRHHMVFMNEMLCNGQFENAQEYIQYLLQKVDALPSDAYSSNPTINAITGRYLNDAKAAGINVTCDIRTSDKIVLSDDELCMLLTNMLENALDACLAMPDDSERFIHFKLHSSEEHFTVTCENSTQRTLIINKDGSVITSKEDTQHHGFGISIMRQITEKRSGHFSVSCSDGCFTVTATM